MKRILAFSAVAALALAGALPATAQTVEWGGGFAGQTMGTSGVSGGGIFVTSRLPQMLARFLRSFQAPVGEGETTVTVA